MKLVSVKPAKDGVHKYEATFKTDDEKEKKTKFGAKGYTDYTMGASLEQREAYRKRHAGGGREDLNDPLTAGALSYYILWGASRSIKENVAAFRRRFNI